MNYTTLTRGGWPSAASSALVFALPFLSLLAPWGVSACSFLFLLGALACGRSCAEGMRRHWPAPRPVLLAFLLHFLFAALCWLVRPDAHLNTLERPSRMFFAFTALALVLAWRPPAAALWQGAAWGAWGAFALIAWQAFGLEMVRPGGFGNAITFADIALCLAVLALAGLIGARSTLARIWMGAGLLAAMAAALLTGSRGGWIGVVLAAVPLALYADMFRRRRARLLGAAGVLLLCAVVALPPFGLRERIGEAVEETANWAYGGSAFSNVGIRLELWKGAGLIVAEHPLLGIDREQAMIELAQHVAEGSLDPAVLPMPHFHNDAIQATVTGGLAGLAAWLAILLAPLRFFQRQLAQAQRPRRWAQLAPALAGILVVVSYFGFGMTEAVFWSVGGSLLYAQLVFVLMGLCLNAKEEHGTK